MHVGRGGDRVKPADGCSSGSCESSFVIALTWFDFHALGYPAVLSGLPVRASPPYRPPSVMVLPVVPRGLRYRFCLKGIARGAAREVSSCRTSSGLSNWSQQTLNSLSMGMLSALEGNGFYLVPALYCIAVGFLDSQGPKDFMKTNFVDLIPMKIIIRSIDGLIFMSHLS